MSEFEKSITIQYSLISDRSTLSVENQKLLKSAQEASKLAYAPYSKFHVGAAAMLSNGEMVTASNKENASFPAGICAERNLLNYISDHYLGQKIIALAVSANPVEFELNEPVSPCGICRQVMCESERLQNQPYQILLGATSGTVLIFNSAASLLPFHFYLKELKK
jgi:cytidine deaminase